MAGHPRYPSLDAALWMRVDKRGPNECWPWLKAVASHGYGNFTFRAKVWCAHVAAYVVTYGKVPKAKHVLHTCDNRLCCNPAHLYVGTHRQNMEDAFDRNPRMARFDGDPPTTKLTIDQVLEIRCERRNAGYSRKHHLVLAKRFGVHPDTIHSIWSGRTWRTA